MRQLLNRIREVTVYADDYLPHERARGLYRYGLPIIDILFLYFGVVGFTNGVGSVQEATSNTWQAYWSLGIAFTAGMCWVGVTFPRLWALELAFKCVLIGLVAGYVALFLFRGAHDPLVTATAGLIIILIVLPIWRVGDLSGNDLYVWRAKRAAVREQRQADTE
jgi:hypothetical protein